MSLAGLLDHTVIARRFEDDGTDDDREQPILSAVDSDPFKAAIQARSAREVPRTDNAGTAVSTHVIYVLPRDLLAGDSIIHSATDCPVAVDLPTCSFDIVGVRNAAGRGHHLEVDATLVGPSGTDQVTPAPGS